MSAWITITTPSGNIYRVASVSGEFGGAPYRGVLVNTPDIEGRAQAAGEAGNRVREQSIVIANVKDDGTAIVPVASESIWGAEVEVAIDGVAEVWHGVVRSWSQDGRGELTISASEDVLGFFKKLLPDLVIRTADFASSSREAVNKPIAVVFGGTAAAPVRVRTNVIDRRVTGGNTVKLAICSGEIRQVVKVWQDGVEITTGFTAYLGAAGQVNHPELAYLDFAVDPRDASGRWPDILVDVVGLKLGACTEAQCRNPARVLGYLLTTGDTGVGGWGLGVDPATIDAASFAQAVTDCDSIGFKIDGALYDQKAASFWVNQIVTAMRGRLTKESGLLTLRVDKDSASVATFTTSNMKVQAFGLGPSSERKNKVISDYRIDATNGNFLAVATREDDTGFNGSIDKIGLNERRIPLYLVTDETAANKLADYWIRWEEYSENQIRFETTSFASTLREGQTITINNADLGLSNSLYRVTTIKLTDWTATVTARSYSASIFSNSAPAALPSDPPTDPTAQFGALTSAPPGTPSGLSFSTDIRVQNDGTTVSYIDGTFVTPGGTIVVKVEVGEGASPATWATLGTTADGAFRFEPAKPGQLYTFRLSAFNAAGKSSTVTGSETAASDSSVPGKPIVPTASCQFRRPMIRCWQNAIKTLSLSGFYVYRSDTAGGNKILVGFAPCSGNDDGVILVDEGAAYAATYYYTTKAITKTGVASVSYSDEASVATAQIATADIATGAVKADTIDAGAVTSLKITGDQIVAKDFRTVANAGTDPGGGVVNGIRFSNNGIEGWNGGVRKVFIDPATGIITARGGYLGNGVNGWVINDTSISNGKTSLADATNAGVWIGVDGISAGPVSAAPTFKVTAAGVVTAVSGTVGGWSLGTTVLCSDGTSYGGTNKLVINSNGTLWSCWTLNAQTAQICIVPSGISQFTGGAHTEWTPSSFCIHTCGINSHFYADVDKARFGVAGAIYSGVLQAGSLTLTAYNVNTVGGCLLLGSAGGVTTNTSFCAGTYLQSGTYLCSGSCIMATTHMCATCFLASTWICSSASICANTSLHASTCITAGTCVYAQGAICSSGGHTSRMVLGTWGHSAAFTDGTADRIYFGTYRTNPSGADLAYMQVMNESGTGGTCIRNDGIWAAACITAGTCVTANGIYSGTKDIYSGKQVRAAGWYTGDWAGLAAEMGISDGEGYFYAYDRSAARFHPNTFGGGDAGGNHTMRFSAASVAISGTTGLLTVSGAITAGTTIVAGTHVVATCDSYGQNLHVTAASFPSVNFYSGGGICTRLTGNGTVLGFINGAMNAWYFYTTTNCMCVTGTIGCTSARSTKCCYTDINVLDGIRRLSVQAWQYKTGSDWNVGPYAEDVQREFPWLSDGHGIHSLDGLALRGLQEVDARVTGLEARIANLESQLADRMCA